MSESSESRPPRNGLVAFVDRSCGGKKIPAALQSLGFDVIVQRDRFPDDADDADDADDTTILAACGENDWIYVAQDFAVRKNPAELKALEAAGVHALFLRGHQEPAEWVIRNLRASNAKIVAALRATAKPIHIEVFADGIRILNEP